MVLLKVPSCYWCLLGSGPGFLERDCSDCSRHRHIWKFSMFGRWSSMWVYAIDYDNLSCDVCI